MNVRSRRKSFMLLVLIIGAIPAIIILGDYFGISKSASIPLIVILSLLCGTVALWAHANRHNSRRQWWQDDSASGWRGY